MKKPKRILCAVLALLMLLGAAAAVSVRPAYATKTEAELEEEQRKLYLAAVVDAREKLQAAKPEDKMAVFAVLMRLREICCDPRLIADNWTGGSS